ncbi:DUF6863 domain-containing protein [Legionella micdadei]|uniref:Uncharacterized protein n=1 Tax=Legionella micdadei TaxID=451 RepID=A0A098GFQ9_LEGMI|nr:hypothetical protein [Legionella micdadei]ARG98048.1 hypothetical protein B6N58_10455 [Legionella micdadei]ARH00844.1 hypothetical protein B6V88_10675 [Legionella micdadei]KTD30126.1 hypothetical protein Lmic_0307 [Legionella micdadei]NSL18499.1 hypothetical protein [Legionella micdadei]CEG60321.1 protein of unknown function [Legionella micdadei]
MKLNSYVYELLKIFGNESGDLRYRYYREVDVSSHLVLEQDQSMDYFLHRTHELLIMVPHPILAKECLHWQIKETYRLVNTALASCSPSLDPFREQLFALKNKLEKDDYLAEFLKQISMSNDSDLVCSGHGVYYSWHNIIDLANYGTHTEVLFYSGLGGSLSQSLGTDIENEQFDPEKVVVRDERAKEEVDYPSMFFFSSTGRQHVIPDFTLEDCHKLPHPRVIEPETGRVVYDMNQVPRERSSFSLSTVIQKFPNRKIHWAACTAVVLPDGKKEGPCADLIWSKRKEEDFSQSPAKRKRETESADEQSYPMQSI